ncbi:hypothetical protein [Amycolatopsis azurea]|uniref:Uncharacterized protein n=1 Tax=Amycolatopsis azurea DSM 43854 TaxID=1238180 RepID=M2Q5H9_9PSEU|nr:hypothetical protein [Amycolatopsis azurea]EMD22011.1 hypothetical protein C791_0497 [Amycolatopsis azurea DSM 43854]OOC07615.1 hypothetical protein B0293_05550 [Amycolatopsis azurea DSM 43854]
MDDYVAILEQLTRSARYSGIPPRTLPGGHRIRPDRGRVRRGRTVAPVRPFPGLGLSDRFEFEPHIQALGMAATAVKPVPNKRNHRFSISAEQCGTGG